MQLIQAELSTCTSQTPQAESYRKEQGPDYERDSGPSGHLAKGSRSRPTTLTPSLLKQPPRALTTSKRGSVCFLTSCGHADVILSRSESPDGNGSMTRISNTYPGIKLP